MLPYHWILDHHGSRVHGNGVRSGLCGSGVRDSPRVN